MKMVSWQRAFVLFYQGKVDVLEFHGATARSGRTTHRLPSVIRLRTYIAPRRASRLKFSRENVYLRDNYTCQYCAIQFAPKDLTLDHVVPASKNGGKTWTNVVAACRACNHRKGNRTPLGADMPLLNEPRMPSWLPSLQPAFQMERVPEEWEPYLQTGTS